MQNAIINLFAINTYSNHDQCRYMETRFSLLSPFIDILFVPILIEVCTILSVRESDSYLLGFFIFNNVYTVYITHPDFALLCALAYSTLLKTN